MISQGIQISLLIVLLRFHDCFCFFSKFSNKNIVALNKDLIKTASETELLSIIETLPSNFKKSDINGCWKVIKTIKSPEWTKYSNVLSLGQSNRNFQIFDGKTNNFINLSEYYGSRFYATASGTYSPRSSSSSGSKIDARVDRIDINVFGLKFKLNVSGDGVVNALHCTSGSSSGSGRIRVFQNEDGAIAIQESYPLPTEYSSLFDSLFNE